jgi:hypothetical protein
VAATKFEHVGSAHTDGELAALLQTARENLRAGQQNSTSVSTAVIEGR